MSDTQDAREVIAQQLESYMWCNEGEFSALSIAREAADRALAALADAGYAVVRKGAPDDRYEQGYTDGGNSKLADVILFFDEVFEVEPMGYDLNARIIKELEERF